MSALEKAVIRIKSIPKDYTYDEVKTLLNHFGYSEVSRGVTSGSRVGFCRNFDNKIILLHRPHPSNVLSVATVKDIVAKLKRNGDIV